MSRPTKKIYLIIISFLLVVLAITGFIVWKKNSPSYAIEATVTELPSCGSERCTSSYILTDSSGQKIYINTYKAKTIDGDSSIKCITVEELNVGDKIKFNLRLEIPPATALTSQTTYSTCYNSKQGSSYFLRKM